MPRRTTATRPVPFRAPRIPQIGKRRRVVERKGRELRPLAPVEVPMPPDQDEVLLARWEAWRALTGGSLPEYIVWQWLVNKKKQVPGVDFLYQHPMFGGRTAFGGYLVDYFFPGRRMGWRVMGLRWHRTNPDDRARDSIAKQLLSSEDILIIDLYEDDLMTRDTFTLEKAWRGESVSTARNL